MKIMKENEKLILIPEASLIASNVENLRQFFLEQLSNHPDDKEVILDVDGIEIVDSLGVNLIVGLFKQLNSQSKSFKIINAGEKFMQVAEFFRFTAIFPVELKESLD